MGSIVYLTMNDIEIPYISNMSETDKSQGDEAMTAAGTIRVDRPTQGVLSELSITTLPMPITEAQVLRNNLRNNLLGAVTIEGDLSLEERTFYLKSVKYAWNVKNGYNDNNTFQKGARALTITLKEKGNGVA